MAAAAAAAVLLLLPQPPLSISHLLPLQSSSESSSAPRWPPVAPASSSLEASVLPPGPAARDLSSPNATRRRSAPAVHPNRPQSDQSANTRSGADPSATSPLLPALAREEVRVRSQRPEPPHPDHTHDPGLHLLTRPPARQLASDGLSPGSGSSRPGTDCFQI